MTTPISIFWFRRDLRIDDNAGLYRALKGANPVLCLFIFDTEILDKLDDKQDPRVTFIYNTIANLREVLHKHGSSLLVLNDTPLKAWEKVLITYDVKDVYLNHDYEPGAKKRDAAIKDILTERSIGFHTYKDQVIFDGDEVVKADGKPYTVYTPYMRRWHEKLKPFYLKPYPVKNYLKNLYQTGALAMPDLEQLGFEKSSMQLPDKEYEDIIADYASTRDYPGITGTTHIGMHLRFGTVSIRALAANGKEQTNKTWLNELVWREFYMMVLNHFPATVNHAFRPEYDRIQWINNEDQFEAWCEGKTGYPLVDAGMRELNTTGFMHNRVRMVTASFLSKHLLIDWRWGERYFAAKLLDYEMASNVGGWQWAAGSGTDAAPYFRIFNPEAQMKRFDKDLKYIKKWVPEYADFSKYPKPIVEHTFARERCLKAFKAALAK